MKEKQVAPSMGGVGEPSIEKARGRSDAIADWPYGKYRPLDFVGPI